MTRFSKIITKLDKKSYEYKKLLGYLRSRGIIDSRTYLRHSVKKAMKKYCNK